MDGFLDERNASFLTLDIGQGPLDFEIDTGFAGTDLPPSTQAAAVQSRLPSYSPSRRCQAISLRHQCVTPRRFLSTLANVTLVRRFKTGGIWQ